MQQREQVLQGRVWRESKRNADSGSQWSAREGYGFTKAETVVREGRQGPSLNRNEQPDCGKLSEGWNWPGMASFCSQKVLRPVSGRAEYRCWIVAPNCCHERSGTCAFGGHADSTIAEIALHLINLLPNQGFKVPGSYRVMISLCQAQVKTSPDKTSPDATLHLTKQTSVCAQTHRNTALTGNSGCTSGFPGC